MGRGVIAISAPRKCAVANAFFFGGEGVATSSGAAHWATQADDDVTREGVRDGTSSFFCLFVVPPTDQTVLLTCDT
jgi:hypothetical protein